MENVNINVDDADAIFIPSNIQGDRTNYTEFKLSFFRTIPQNCALVRRGLITQKLRVRKYRFGKRKGTVKAGGFWIPRFTRTIYVPIIDRTIDYPKAKYLTKDDINATVDIVLNVRITDPVKYLNQGRYALHDLNSLTQNLLTAYVRRYDFDQLAIGNVDLNDFQNMVDEHGNVVTENAYVDFEKRYGISIQNIRLNSVKLPLNLEKLRDDRIEEEHRKEAQKVRLEAYKEAAEAEAERIKIKAEAEAKRLAIRLETLRNNGVSEQSINDVLGTFLATDNPKASVIVGAGSNNRSSEFAVDVAAGVAAAQRAVQQASQQTTAQSAQRATQQASQQAVAQSAQQASQQTTTQSAQQANQNSTSGVDRIKTLKDLIRVVLNNHLIDDSLLDIYKNFFNNLSNNQSLIDNINNFSEQQFNQFTGIILNGKLGNHFNSERNGNSRGGR